MHQPPEDSSAKQAYKEVTEKPAKKIKAGQKLTWYHVITRDLNAIDIDLQKLSNYQKTETHISNKCWTA